MRANVYEIPGIECGKPGKLKLDKGFRDAVADHLRHRWPTATAKNAAREYDLTLPRAREAVAGKASLTTLESIFKKGGWPVALAIIADVIGHGIAHHIAEMRTRHEENGRRLSSLFGDPGSGRGADRDGDPGGAWSPDHGDESADRRVGERRYR